MLRVTSLLRAALLALTLLALTAAASADRAAAVSPSATARFTAKHCTAKAAAKRAEALRGGKARASAADLRSRIRTLRSIAQRCEALASTARRHGRRHRRPTRGGTTPAPSPTTPAQPTTPAPTTPAPTTPVPPAPTTPDPVPTTPDPSSGDCPSYTTFRVGSPACWRPYSASSPWNRKVGSSPRLATRSSQVVSRMLSWGSAQQMRAGHADTDGDYDHPVYFSKSTDPVYTLHATRPWGTADIEGARIHIPAQARPAAGGDGHMAVITEDGWEYDMWTVSHKDPSGGTLEFGWGGRTRIDGDGLGSNATAAHFGLAAGEIRASELRANKINHALFMGVKCTDAKSASVYPAAPNTGEPCSEDGLSNTDAPPLGSRFVLDMSSSEIEALNVPRWKKTILHALADYGMITGDAFGSGAWGLQMESGTSYTSFGQADPNGAYAQSVGAPEWGGAYLFNLQDGVNWQQHLRLVDPCVSRGTC